MSTDLYLVKLKYKPNTVGAGAMTLQLAVDPVRGTATGKADGTLQQGTQHSPSFTASVSGHIHGAGFGPITRLAGVDGEAVVAFPPPAIGSYLTKFSATFAVDNDWNGTGKFVVGDNAYDCQVTRVS